MIPILYGPDETSFVTNGIGRLSDCTRCIVTEERNGIYECEFDYPLTGVHYDEIQFGRIVGCTHDDNRDIQPFVIYSRSVPDLNGVVTFNAHHISYRLNNIVVLPFTAGSIAETFLKMKARSANKNPFTFWTDKTTTGTFEVDVPKGLRGMLGGEQGSILDIYGAGDYKFDRFDVRLYAHRGVDTDVEIRYSKNLTNMNQDIDDSGSYNAIAPFWKDTEENLVMLPEVFIVYSGIQPVIAYLTDHNNIIIRTETNEPIEVAYSDIRAVPYDMSDAFEEMPTMEQLRTAAQTRFENSNAWLPDENLKIDFVQLWQTEEFKEYAAMQRVSLCDTVSVYYPAAGITKVKQKVIKVVYNVLLDRYDSIELGQMQNSLGQAIRQEILQEVPTTSMMESAIQYATEMIRGGLGGYVVMTPGPNGYPQEILIMDSPDVNTAVNVWRFNQGGLGHSSNGYDGPFSDIALTQDGRINASIITTGILNANIIKAGILADEENNTSFNLATGLLIIKKGNILLGGGNFAVNDEGELYSKSGTIGGFSITSTNLYYQSSVRNVVFSNEEISYAASYTDNSRRGATLSANRLSFKDRSDESSWSLTERAYIYYNRSAPYMEYYTDGGMRFFVNGTVRMTIESSSPQVYVNGSIGTSGAKPRVLETKNYNTKMLYCYETPSPMFGDIGEAVLDEEGLCYVEIDDILNETIIEKIEYQVFLQKEGEGDCWIAGKNPRFFVIQGTPGLRVAWELKARQIGYETTRFEDFKSKLDEYVTLPNEYFNTEDYIEEQEALLYG